MKARNMTPEVVSMIEARHSAEQRGDILPVGRLMALYTEHGLIKFPAEDGEGTGPDIGMMDGGGLVVCGPWRGLPDLRVQSTKRCPHCLHVCDLCDRSGKIQCQGVGCGGRGWRPGAFVPCPGPGCRKETGKFKPGCEVCVTSGSQGEIASEVQCETCRGTKLMTCVRCRGTGKFATGRVNGVIDWRARDCKFCEGTGYQGKYSRQRIEKFINASLVRDKTEHLPRSQWFALGPIHALDLVEYPELRSVTRNVYPDEKQDLMFLIVPIGSQVQPQKAYLVGGIVRGLNVRRQEVGA